MRTLLFALLVMMPMIGHADEHDMIFEASAERPFDEAYQAVYGALEDARFYVIFEANLGRNLAGMAGRFGDDYNRNGLEAIRSMAFCNPWYANQVSNQDPRMLALCPLRLSLTHKEGVTRVLLVRPSMVGADSPARALLQELESEITAAIIKGLNTR